MKSANSMSERSMGPAHAIHLLTGLAAGVAGRDLGGVLSLANGVALSWPKGDDGGEGGSEGGSVCELPSAGS